jgi:ABC-2 type transport system permease protein/ribosome-dependent ATPase
MIFRRALVVAQKEAREIARDRIYFALAFLLPVVLMLVFCYGMTQEVQNVPIAIVDYDRSAQSRDYAHRFIESRYFEFKGYVDSVRAAEPLLLDGDIRAVIVLPTYFEERLAAGLPVDIQTLLDGTFTYRLRTVDGYIQAINQAVSAEIQSRYLAGSTGVSIERAQQAIQPLRVETRYLYNQELREIWSIAPGLVMFVLTLTAPLLMALSIVREKETGTIYNIYASTITRGEYLLGKLLPNVIVSFTNGTVLVLIAVWYFGAPLKGGVVFFLSAMLVYVVWATSLGLLISVITRTQMAATMVTVVLVMVFVMQFSGMMIPVSSMTGANYIIAHTIAAMHFNDVVTHTFLKGGGLEASWREFVALIVLMSGFLVFGYLLFHKRSAT